MDTSWRFAAFTADGEHQPVSGRSAARGCGSVSMDADQECLPEALPLAVKFFAGGLARRPNRSVFDGTEARCVLLGLLLVFDGLVVRCRRDEYLVGGDHRCFRPVGKGRAERVV